MATNRSPGPARIFIAALLVSGLAACSGAPGGSGVAVVDLAAVAKATGHDLVLDQEVARARQSLEAQLNQVAVNLEQQLQAEQTRLGGAAAAAKEKTFQELTAQARAQLAQTQTLAQQKAQEFQAGLVGQYRQALQPVTEKVARDRNARVVLVTDATLLWFEPEADLTAAVIAELRSKPLNFPAAPAAAPAAESVPADSGTANEQ